MRSNDGASNSLGLAVRSARRSIAKRARHVLQRCPLPRTRTPAGVAPVGRPARPLPRVLSTACLVLRARLRLLALHLFSSIPPGYTKRQHFTRRPTASTFVHDANENKEEAHHRGQYFNLAFEVEDLGLKGGVRHIDGRMRDHIRRCVANPSAQR